MADDDHESKSLRVVTFKGTEEDYHMWSKKFMAYQTLKYPKSKKALLNLNSSPIIEVDDDLCDANELAYCALVQAVSDTISFNIVDNAKSAAYPSGDAAVAWAGLKKKWEPTEATDLNTEIKELFGSSLDVSVNPDTWIEELKSRQIRINDMGESISDRLLMVHILNHLPGEYQATVDTITPKTNNSVESITKDLRNKFKRDLDHEKKDGGNPGGTALYAGNHNNKNKGSGKFKGNCHWCGIKGHKEFECRKKKAGEPKKVQQGGTSTKGDFGGVVLTALALRSVAHQPRLDPTVWIGDTGASTHIKGTVDGMKDLRDAAETDQIEFGNGETLKATKIGTWTGMVKDNSGTTIPFTLTDVKVVPGIHYNLFSLTAALTKGATLGSKDDTITITKGNTTIPFDTKVKSGQGHVCGLRMIDSKQGTASRGAANKQGALPSPTNTTQAVTQLTTAPQAQPKKQITVPAAIWHQRLGHAGEQVMQDTAAQLGVKLTGSTNVCEDCAVAKAKQKPVPKTSTRTTTTPGELMYLDISSVAKSSASGAKNWILLMDDYTGFCISRFVKKKSSLPIVIMKVLHELKDKNIQVQTIRCDNAGENRALQQSCQAEGLGIKFEYTAPGTPPTEWES